jgi:hypothetical protein
MASSYLHNTLTRLSAFVLQGTSLVHRNMISRVALDLVLWLNLARVMGVPFVDNVSGVYLDNRPAHVSRLRVPRYAISDFELPFHVMYLRYMHDSAFRQTSRCAASLNAWRASTSSQLPSISPTWDPTRVFRVEA